MIINIFTVFLLIILNNCYLSNIRKVYEERKHMTAFSYYLALKNNRKFKPYRIAIKELSKSFKDFDIEFSFEDKTNIKKILTFLDLNKKNIEIIDKGIRNLDASFSEKNYIDAHVDLYKDLYFEKFSFESKDGLSINVNELHKEYNKFKKLHSEVEAPLVFIFFSKIYLNYISGNSIKEKKEKFQKDYLSLKELYFDILEEVEKFSKPFIEAKFNTRVLFNKINNMKAVSLKDKVKKDVLKLSIFLIYAVNTKQIFSYSLKFEEALEKNKDSRLKK